MSRKKTDEKRTSHIRKTFARRLSAATLITFILLLCPGCISSGEKPTADTPAVTVIPSGDDTEIPQIHTSTLTVADIPEYSGNPYAVINDNLPDFEQSDLTEQSFERYSELDELGRCGEAYACIGKDLMPTEERGSIGHIKPSGWQFQKYDFVDGKYLYNRCHLIGFQLAAENDNERNLITGTRYMNTQGMLPFENEVADYVKSTNNHVLYRVTPIYQGQELVARGVEMEAQSVEDDGAGVRYHVYVYNCQPGVTINYLTGESQLSESSSTPEPANTDTISVTPTPNGNITYILNTRSEKFHKPTCSGAAQIAPHNRQDYTGSREALIQQGYKPCGMCKP